MICKHMSCGGELEIYEAYEYPSQPHIRYHRARCKKNPDHKWRLKTQILGPVRRWGKKTDKTAVNKL